MGTPPHFASPGFCFAKPLFGLAKRKLPGTFNSIYPLTFESLLNKNERRKTKLFLSLHLFVSPRHPGAEFHSKELGRRNERRRMRIGAVGIYCKFSNEDLIPAFQNISYILSCQQTNKIYKYFF
jgi:hypothetical protein